MSCVCKQKCAKPKTRDFLEDDVKSSMTSVGYVAYFICDFILLHCNNIPRRYSPNSNSSLSSTSASELSYLKASVWSLENRLKEASFSSKNLSNSYSEVTKEKYELLEELTKEKEINRNLFEQMKHEREEHTMFQTKLLKEIAVLHREHDKNQWIMVCKIEQLTKH